MADAGADFSEVFCAFLRLGLTSFGGPIAHLSYFRDEFVSRRRWLHEEHYAQILALCQLLPGPASSQVGIVIGYQRAGVLGSIAAWCGFTLPSALALTAFAYGVHVIPNLRASGWIHGLLIAAVAVVALAVANMAASLAPDRSRRSLAIGIAIGALLLPSNGFSQLALLAVGAVYGWRFLCAPHRSIGPSHPGGSSLGAFSLGASSSPLKPRSGNLRVALGSLAALILLMLGLPTANHLISSGPLLAFTKFFEVGALVFGGGHVVLPLLAAQVVGPGWISNMNFLAGYGAAQAMPGPLFAFAAYLGVAMDSGPVHGLAGAALCLIAIFMPSFFLIAAVLPLWDRVRSNATAAAVLLGINAAVVGLLLAALYNPVWLGAVHSTTDVALVLAAFLALAMWRAPAWSVVLGSALVAGLVGKA